MNKYKLINLTTTINNNRKYYPLFATPTLVYEGCPQTKINFHHYEPRSKIKGKGKSFHAARFVLDIIKLQLKVTGNIARKFFSLQDEMLRKCNLSYENDLQRE